MVKAQKIAHVTKIHEAQQKRKVDVVVVAEIGAKKAAEKETAATVQAEASAKAMDDTVVHGVLIDLTNTGVMDEIGEMSNAAMADEVEPLISDLASKQTSNSNEATSQDKDDHDAVIVSSTSSSPTPLNYAQHAIVTRDQVQDMIGQALESFSEHQHQENEQFRLLMQTGITT